MKTWKEIEELFKYKDCFWDSEQQDILKILTEHFPKKMIDTLNINVSHSGNNITPDVFEKWLFHNLKISDIINCIYGRCIIVDIQLCELTIITFNNYKMQIDISPSCKLQNRWEH